MGAGCRLDAMDFEWAIAVSCEGCFSYSSEATKQERHHYALAC